MHYTRASCLSFRLCTALSVDQTPVLDAFPGATALAVLLAPAIWRDAGDAPAAQAAPFRPIANVAAAATQKPAVLS